MHPTVIFYCEMIKICPMLEALYEQADLKRNRKYHNEKKLQNGMPKSIEKAVISTKSEQRKKRAFAECLFKIFNELWRPISDKPKYE